MLEQAQWDALSDEEKELRADEKPEPEGVKPEEKTIDELTRSIKDLKIQLDSLQNEKQGIYRDLRQERDTRQQLEAALGEMQRRGGDEIDINALADDDNITAGQVKKLIAGLQNNAQHAENLGMKQRSAENYSNDEERLHELSKAGTDEYPISYVDAIKEFEQMAKKNLAYWTAVQQESLRVNGRPAEIAYRIALTSKTFLSKIRAAERESILSKLETEGQIKPRKLPSGGSGKAEINPSTISEEDLLKLSESQLDEILAKSG